MKMCGNTLSVTNNCSATYWFLSPIENKQYMVTVFKTLQFTEGQQIKPNGKL